MTNKGEQKKTERGLNIILDLEKFAGNTEP